MRVLSILLFMAAAICAQTNSVSLNSIDSVPHSQDVPPLRKPPSDNRAALASETDSTNSLDTANNKLDLSHGLSPFGLALYYPIQIPSKKVPIFGISINAGVGQHIRVYGLDVGIYNSVVQSIWGLQLGMVNHSDNQVWGTQMGIVNSADKEVWGMQAGLVNRSEHVVGAQIGLINDCGTLLGVQFGLFNRVRNRANVNFWFPFLNIGF